MIIDAAEQFPQLRRAENPISKVILEFFKRELTIIIFVCSSENLGDKGK